MNRSGKIISLGMLLLAAAALPGATGCGGAGKPDRVYAEPAGHLDGRLVEGGTRFGFNLFHILLDEAPGENIFISPASVSMALAMTLNGAAGETFDAMERTLQLQGMSREEVNSAFADLKTILQNPDPRVKMAVANSLWVREGDSFHEDFLGRNRDYFDAAVAALNFDLPGSADTINGWVKDSTGGKIEEIVEGPIDPLTVLFLINAIHFKGAWSEQFDPQQTREIPFTLADGSRKQHPLMFQSGSYRYLKGERFQAVSLPYGEKGRVSMYVFLPDPGSSLPEFCRELTPENWAQWLASFGELEGEIGLPRFKFEYEASLNGALKTLGMAVAFDPAEADFGGMRPVPPNLFISEVKHKTFVEVNEEGTEAAAATSVEMRLTAMPERFNMIVDRPFFFAIVDDKTDSILFIGSVSEPF